MNQLCDVYSYGMVLWEILMGKVPFTGVRDNKVTEEVESGRVRHIHVGQYP